MKSKLILLALVVLVLSACQPNPLTKRATLVFYNVENLFDTINDPAINDEEFLPDAEKKWNSERYTKKLEDLSRVLGAVNPEELPEIIGLCEVENRQVVEDLAATAPLAEGKYQAVHIDSPDKRGIDVALLFRKGAFKLIHHEALPVDPGFETRDILHVYGKLGKDKIHLFVNHWPSRWGGLKKSQPNRLVAAQTLKTKVDELLTADPQAKIIIMGDMNDEPDNKSLAEVLNARAPNTQAELYNLMIPLDEQQKGSYFYRGNWNMLDNLVVSASVLRGKGFVVTDQLGQVFQQEWMEYRNKNGQVSPNRTYGGPNYYGGISDHFPVYLQLNWQ
ncbi:endonuclease/exonuclease/phosphatase family protein [uncultured Sunxiuqinia sp.]|uniref:endonuclease/exonuclease/phosphatase family protein n=1 Tax=uncultured Sunxiuqinia sp. TaxID=1573825 RepID=UPI0026176B0F|nr:endonuclease/exonuclease/phosphatase family protein [uncultured Sunxiuqinia sp.]